MDYIFSLQDGGFRSSDVECGGISQDWSGGRASTVSETNIQLISPPKAPTCARLQCWCELHRRQRAGLQLDVSVVSES